MRVAKIGRNDPCPCGGGKKYKKCCEGRDHAEAAERARSTQQQLDLAALAAVPMRSSTQPPWDAAEDDLDRASNSVVDLLHEGRLDDAEQAALRLLADYPEVHDGFERLGMVYEARGDRVRAADMYQRALDFTLDKDGYDDEVRDWYRSKLSELARTPNV